MFRYLVKRFSDWLLPPVFGGIPEGLDRYPENYVGPNQGDEPKWLNPIKIIVETERDKEQLLLAFRYIHNLRDLDTDFIAVNYLAHMYLEEDLIEVKNPEVK